MPAWQVLLDAVGVVLLLVLLYGIALVIRRRVPRALQRHLRAQLPRPVRQGRARLASRGRPLLRGPAGVVPHLLPVARGPSASWHRADLQYTGRRDPAGVEELSLYTDHVVVTCQTPAGELELAMSPGLAHGLPVVAGGDAARHPRRPAG